MSDNKEKELKDLLNRHRIWLIVGWSIVGGLAGFLAGFVTCYTLFH